MGWASGTDIAEVFEKLLLKYVPKNKLKQEAKKVLKALESQDWDCQNEVELFDYFSQVELKKEYKEDPSWFADWEIEEINNKIKKYKKKFGF